MTLPSKQDKTGLQDLLPPQCSLIKQDEGKKSDLLPASPNGHQPHLVLSARMDRTWYLPVWKMPRFWKIPPEAPYSPSPGRAVSLAVTHREGWQIAELEGIIRESHSNRTETISPYRGVRLFQIQGILRMEACSLHLIKGMGLEIRVEWDSELRRGEPKRAELDLQHPELGAVFRGEGFLKEMG